jgi:hypothetical protein
MTRKQLSKIEDENYNPISVLEKRLSQLVTL